MLIEFEKIYFEYNEQIFRFVFNICGDSRLSEELTKETFRKAFSSAAKYRGKVGFKAWLTSIALDICMKRISYDNKKESSEISADKNEELRKRILELPKEYMRVVVLRNYASLPFSQIAELYGTSQNSAKVLYCRAKRALMK